jgi:RNA polymerase sigma-70 factor, ECF subfamily
MTSGSRTIAEVAPAQPDDGWVAELTVAGPAGQVALQRLHGLLLRASRHQVWRLRNLLPGAGAGDLEDLAQQAADDALVSVLRQLSSYQGRSRFTTWAYKFGILHAGGAVRRQAWRNREVSLPDTIMMIDRSPSPAELSEAAQLVRAVEAAIVTVLTPHQRRVAIALLVDDVPIDVLAERLGTTRNSLYKTLHDARRRLRAALVAAGELDPTPDRSPR